MLAANISGASASTSETNSSKVSASTTRPGMLEDEVKTLASSSQFAVTLKEWVMGGGYIIQAEDAKAHPLPGRARPAHPEMVPLVTVAKTGSAGQSPPTEG